MATNWYEVSDLEKKNSHLEGELKDAKRILESYMKDHQRESKSTWCNCQWCNDARAWLARNKG